MVVGLLRVVVLQRCRGMLGRGGWLVLVILLGLNHGVEGVSLLEVRSYYEVGCVIGG